MKSYLLQQPVESLELKPFIFHDETNELTNYLWQNPGSWIVRRALDPVTKQVDDQHLVVVYSQNSPDTADVVSLRIGYFEIYEGQHQVWQGWMQNGSFSTAFNQWREEGDQIRSALQQPNVTLSQKKLLDIDKTVFLSSLAQMVKQGPWDQNKLIFPTESQIDLTLKDLLCICSLPNNSFNLFS